VSYIDASNSVRPTPRVSHNHHAKQGVEFAFECFEIKGRIIVYYNSEFVEANLSSSSSAVFVDLNDVSKTLFDTLARAIARRVYELNRGIQSKRVISTQQDELHSSTKLLQDFEERLLKTETSRAIAVSECEKLIGECETLRSQLRAEQTVAQEAIAQHKALSIHMRRLTRKLYTFFFLQKIKTILNIILMPTIKNITLHT
jgi:CBS-domain-containing membrane protein